MKQSEFALKTLRENPKDADSKNAAFLERGGYVQKTMAGVYSYLPLGLRVMKKIEAIVRDEMNKIGGQEVLLPVLGPKENWQATGRWDDLDVLYKLKTADNKEVALNPTHEEIIVPLAKGLINSYKDLPMALYQIQDKFRNEKRAKSGLLRGREFLMKDLYSYHLTEGDLDNYYEKVAKSYEKIFQRVGIGDTTVMTFASGGSFSKYSHEYQTLTENGEDVIYLCEKCNVAVNKEIIDEHNFCPECKSKELVEKKAIEVGNIFKLKTKYSTPFNLKVINDKGEETTVIMGCYGLGVSRLFGAIVEVLADEKKIIWPEEITPFKKHIISLGKNKEALELYDRLNDKENVLLDDRDVSAGEKFADADLVGTPIRIIVSEKSLANGGVEVAERSGSAKIVALEQII
jgi:prolyl-tRNA synthetase